ncbi:MAG: D-arabinono-1,4-lactone oxidase [Pseudomonadales bacterium]|jgi:FAD/FMN-containing dehydrogenase|nr:D-arabinono-1,4-lactone oxidase [Pseudomonadales bacterium]
MAQWHNWSGRLKHKPQQLTHVYSEDQAASLALACRKAGQSLRAVGGGHSHQDLVGNNDIIVDTLGLSGIISSDQASNTAWVWGGSRIFSLGNALHQVGLALPNQGDIDQQSISGATATGTHGTGATLQNLSSRVVGARLALADGSLVNCSANENSELWQASRLHLGAFGIITRLQLALNASFRLVEKTWQTPLSTLLQELDGYVANNRHCEFFWYPRTDTAQVKVINVTTEPGKYPLGGEGQRHGWSYEVLPNHRPHKHTEMEYSVPAESGIACMNEIQKLLANTFTDVSWPVEYRTLAEDDVWLSTAYQRPTVTISVHQGIDEPDEAYYRACEEIFLAHGGKPHWGKVNYLNDQQMADLHPRWSDWWRVRDSVDPTGTFLNPYMHSIRP